jgi:DNA polymerase elongation subunit (family B)
MTMYAINKATELGYEVIYGDTDSIFVRAKDPKDFQSCLEEAKQLQRTIESGMPDFLKTLGFDGKCMFTMSIDKIWSSFFTLDVKKRYAGYVEPRHEMKTVGLETRRSDSSRYAKGIQEKIIKMILEDVKKEDLEKFLAEELNKMDVVPPIEIAVPSAITKDLDEYKRLDKKTGKKVDFNPVQKKAAQFSNRYLKTNFGAGDKPKRFYVKMENAPVAIQEKIDVIALEDISQLPSWLKIDYPRMMLLTMKKKIEKILLIAPYSITWDSIPLKESLKIPPKPPKPPKTPKVKKEKKAKTVVPDNTVQTVLNFKEA